MVENHVARRYINRIDDATSKDEWSYISEIGSKVEFKDVMDVEQRYITFGKELHKKGKPKKTNLEATHEGIRWALDAAGNAGQFIKFVNMTIDKRQTQINKIKKLQNKFDNEVALLNKNKIEKINPTSSSLASQDPNAVKDYLNQLLLEKRVTQSNLQNLQKDLSSMEKELKLQEKQIEDVREHLKAKILSIKDNNKPLDMNEAVKIIRQELDEIGKKYDVSKLSGAFDRVISASAK